MKLRRWAVGWHGPYTHNHAIPFKRFWRRRAAERLVHQKRSEFTAHDMTPMLVDRRAGVIGGEIVDDFRYCWRKVGWITQEAYCGKHGRAAGWPCRRRFWR